MLGRACVLQAFFYDTCDAHLGLYAVRDDPIRTSDTRHAKHAATAAATVHACALATRDENDDCNRSRKEGGLPASKVASKPRTTLAPTTPICGV